MKVTWRIDKERNMRIIIWNIKEEMDEEKEVT